MADSDEDVGALGSPFEELEEDAPRKKPVPVHEQIVTDDRGRRRFHGAFTGGFSAGYFNTVDTKEGWVPRSFISSRSQRATESSTQRPEDFMDEEDLGEFGIAPKKVVTTEKFLPVDEDGKQRKRVLGPARPSAADKSVSGILKGSEILQDLIVPVQMSIGVKLLTQMGWKQGQGIGPRVRRTSKKTYGCLPQPSNNKAEDDDDDIYAAGLMFAPKDVKYFEYISKDNIHGIGYSGINPKTAFLNQRDWLGMGPAPSVGGMRGQGFGVGALEEEDDDIYSQDHLSNYDIDLNVSSAKKRSDLHGWTGPPQTSEQGGLLSVFTKVSNPPTRKIYPPPVVPRDFVPLHKVDGKEHQFSTQTDSTTKPGSVKLTAKERGEALGEILLPSPKKSVFDYIGEEDKARLKLSRGNEKPKQQSKWSDSGNTSSIPSFAKGMVFKSSGFKPFAKDPQKQARYELFLCGKHSDLCPPETESSKMTEWERECESEEFVRAATLYRPLSQTMAARFTSAKEYDEPSTYEEPGVQEHKARPSTKEFGTVSRQRFEWHPDRVLCKRFNIPDPYPGSQSTGIPSNQKTTFTAEEKLDEKIRAIEYKSNNKVTNESQGGDSTKTSALLTGFQAMASRTCTVTLESAASENENLLTSQQETEISCANENEHVVNLAPMDLFKAVFADSSSESESEESDEQNNKEDMTNIENVDKEDNNLLSKQETSKSIIFSPENKREFSQSPGSSGHNENQRLSVYDSKDEFGPALPSSRSSFITTSSSLIRGNFESNNQQERKPRDHKHKKNKKEKSEKYRATDSNDSDFEKKKKKKKSEKGISKQKIERKKKGHSKYSDSEDSGGEYREHRKHKRKKDKKSKEKKRHEYKKDLYDRQQSKIVDWDNYEEKTFDNFASNTDRSQILFYQKNYEDKCQSLFKERKERKRTDEVDSESMNQDIMSKLKNVQLLKEGRMRAADFM